MNASQKERLEQELRFLKESFEAEVISKEEFEKGKERIEKKLSVLNAEKPAEPKPEEPVNAEKTANGQEDDDYKKENASVQQEKAQSNEDVKKEAEIEILEEQEKNSSEESHEEENPKAQETAYEKKSDKPKTSRLFKYGAVFVVLVLILFFSYNAFKNDSSAEKPKAEQEIKFVPVCSADSDCTKEGYTGSCANSGAKNSECQFTEIPKINAIVLNGKGECFNCDTGRVLGILNERFGPLLAESIDYNTEKGKNLIQELGITVLPAYIFSPDLQERKNFNEFKQIFIEKNGYYMLNTDVAASSFYFTRKNMQMKLDLFVIENDASSMKAENNLKEFLAGFKNVKFEKHSYGSQLAQELGLKTFPVFLVNNQVKFGGVQPADVIRENFCNMNNVADCQKNLSKNLI
ncbi:MAG: hypothetical protein AABX00_01855 [Nanoarchaeota archaeon]